MPANLRQLTPRELAIVGKYSAQHAPVRALDQPVADDAGNISTPLLRINTLRRLEDRGVIGRREAEAGERFAVLFRLGSLDPLKAADVSRVPMPPGMSRGDIPASAEHARNRVAAAMVALGGAGSAAASAVWHIIGLEMSIRRWARSTGRREELAAGVLAAGLGMLAAHFGGHGPRPKPPPPRRAL